MIGHNNKENLSHGQVNLEIKFSVMPFNKNSKLYRKKYVTEPYYFPVMMTYLF